MYPGVSHHETRWKLKTRTGCRYISRRVTFFQPPDRDPAESKIIVKKRSFRGQSDDPASSESESGQQVEKLVWETWTRLKCRGTTALSHISTTSTYRQTHMTHLTLSASYSLNDCMFVWFLCISMFVLRSIASCILFTIVTIPLLSPLALSDVETLR